MQKLRFRSYLVKVNGQILRGNYFLRKFKEMPQQGNAEKCFKPNYDDRRISSYWWNTRTTRSSHMIDQREPVMQECPKINHYNLIFEVLIRVKTNNNTICLNYMFNIILDPLSF